MAREGQHDAQLRVRGDAKSGVRELDALANRMNKVEASTARSNARLQQKTQRLAQVTQGAKAGALAAAALAAAVFRFVSSTTEALDRIGKMSAALGASTDEMQRLTFAIERSGGSVDAFEGGMKKFTVGLSDAANKGTGPVAEGIRRIGLSIHQLQGKGVEEQFQLIADGIAKIDDEQEQAAVSAKIFGQRAGIDLVNTLRLGRQGVKELGDELEAMGGIVDKEGIKKSEEFQDELLGVKKRAGVLAAELATGLIPVMESLIFVGEKVVGVMQGIGSAIGDAASAVSNFFVGYEGTVISPEAAAAIANRTDEERQFIEAVTGRTAINAIQDVEKQVRDEAKEIERVRKLMDSIQGNILKSIDDAKKKIPPRKAARREAMTELEQLLGRGAEKRWEELQKKVQKSRDAEEDFFELLEREDRLENERREAMVDIREHRAHRNADIIDLQIERERRLAEAQGASWERMVEIDSRAADAAERRREASRLAEEERLAFEEQRARDEDDQIALLEIQDRREQIAHDRKLDRLREEARQHELEIERDKRAAASKQWLLGVVVATSEAMTQIQGNTARLASTIADATIRDDERRARFKNRMAGLEAMGIGALETVKAAAAFASFNYLQGALHTSAAALAFAQGGVLLAGGIPSGGAGGGAGAGGANPFMASPGATAANGPPAASNGRTETAIPPSAPSAAPRHTSTPEHISRGGSRRGELTLNINALTVDREAAAHIAHRIEDLRNEGVLEEAV